MSHWLNQYASNDFAWQTVFRNGRCTFHRPMGLVERAFDADGRHYEGRADISMQIDISLRTNLTTQAARHHISLAFACLRARYALLMAKAPAELPHHISSRSRHLFVIDVPSSSAVATQEARAQVVFVDDFYPEVDSLAFYNAAQCCSRLLDAESSLSKLYVTTTAASERSTYSYYLVVAHQIGDGVVSNEWNPDFIRLLNMTDAALEAELEALIKSESMKSRLPPPQEALYPPIHGSRTKQRWYWVLTRILRHVRRPLPAGFANPLLRREQMQNDVKRSYPLVLDYSRTPPNLGGTCRAMASKVSTARLQKICKDAGVSVGAGCFAIAALTMMELYERQEDVPLGQRKPFITGFPLNPRPFLVGKPPANSLMLAFSDGIWLPFLPSYLSVEGRLRLLARQAQRQLAVYQKKIRATTQKVDIHDMGSRGSGRMLAIQYLGSIERSASLDPTASAVVPSPQGAYPMRPNMTRQTCGVSSTGRGVALSSKTSYDNADFVAKPIQMFAGVRPREGEFLIGVGGSDLGLWANVSIDMSSMDPEMVDAWQRRFETVLEEHAATKL